MVNRSGSILKLFLLFFIVAGCGTTIPSIGPDPKLETLNQLPKYNLTAAVLMDADFSKYQFMQNAAAYSGSACHLNMSFGPLISKIAPVEYGRVFETVIPTTDTEAAKMFDVVIIPTTKDFQWSDNTGIMVETAIVQKGQILWKGQAQQARKTKRDGMPAGCEWVLEQIARDCEPAIRASIQSTIIHMLADPKVRSTLEQAQNQKTAEDDARINTAVKGMDGTGIAKYLSSDSYPAMDVEDTSGGEAMASMLGAVALGASQAYLMNTAGNNSVQNVLIHQLGQNAICMQTFKDQAYCGQLEQYNQKMLAEKTTQVEEARAAEKERQEERSAQQRARLEAKRKHEMQKAQWHKMQAEQQQERRKAQRRATQQQQKLAAKTPASVNPGFVKRREITLTRGNALRTHNDIKLFASKQSSAVGAYSIGPVKVHKGQYNIKASYQINVVNYTNCTMRFGGYFNVNGNPIKTLDWGLGHGIGPRGKKSLSGEVILPKDIASKRFTFQPEGSFDGCK